MADYVKEHGLINQPQDSRAFKLDSGSLNLRPLKELNGNVARPLG